ncbi:MAG: hypothetical protein NZM31_08710 [Gemmatales bacterium]|nr:hypothetical protein [Gemmatales bacterium]MDW8387073.1 hypothetical protein [Gemmatales bacterium]
MAEDRDAREIQIRQLLPWVDLFSSFHLALHPSKLLLAAAAIVVLTFGWWLLALIFGVPNQLGEWPPNSPRGSNPYMAVTERRGDFLSAEFWLGSMGRRTTPPPSLPPDKPPAEAPQAAAQGSSSPAPAGPEVDQPSLVAEIYSQPPVHLEPFHKFLTPVTGLVKHNPTERMWWYYLVGLLMTVAVWGLVGGAITRMVAVEFARGENIGFVESLRFSAKRFLSYFSAPLLPFGGVALIAIVMIVGGLFLHIPWIGELVAGLLWILALLGGFLMAIILIGLIGWPLMYATISTEGSDNLDALSRSYSYVFQRPWHYLFYSLVAMLYGVLVIFFVVFVTSFMVYLSKWAVGLTPFLSWRSTGDPVSAAFYYAPTSYEWQQLLMKDHPLIRELDPQALDNQLRGTTNPAERRKIVENFLKHKDASGNEIPAQEEDVQKVLQSSGRQQERVLFEIGRERVYQEMNSFQVLGAVFVGFWLHLLFLVMLGFAYSYFWSVSTIIYFLLRKRVDDVDMEEVYLEKGDEDVYPAPITPATSATPTSSRPAAGETARPPEPSRPVAAASEPPSPSASAAPAEPAKPETDSPQSGNTQ